MIARQMQRQAMARDPIWPESMPGAEGIADGQSAPSRAEQKRSSPRSAESERTGAAI